MRPPGVSRRRSRRRAPTTAPPWSATSRPASPTSRAASTAMRAMVDAGCDVIEVGLPYSDPVMDGPTIQAAAQRALDGWRAHPRRAAHGRGRRRDRHADRGDDLLEPRRALRRRRGSPPTSPSAGGAGLITPDLTPDSGAEWIAAADAHDLDKIFLVAPSSTDERIAMTTAACRGFVYATAVMGVTGARAASSDLAGPLVAPHQGGRADQGTSRRSLSGSASATAPRRPRSRRTPTG